LACGTGIWTKELLVRADHVTAIDASLEMISINRAKLNAPQVEYQQYDLFNWQPNEEYDLVFFGFWLSHVPPEKVIPFLQKVAQAVKVGGYVFMADSLRAEQTSTAKDTNPEADSNHILIRTLNDGRSFQIVKVYHTPSGLRDYFTAAGLRADVYTTQNYFIYASSIKE
jgi:demethylmenaquinone methyltransferase/2-methoxy-6-polyprenyl-1,4-benzoquinol methylase